MNGTFLILVKRALLGSRLRTVFNKWKLVQLLGEFDHDAIHIGTAHLDTNGVSRDVVNPSGPNQPTKVHPAPKSV